jgi:hypothetical protein
MADTNIIGGPLEDDIIKQFAARKQMISQVGYRDDNSISYQANAGCWVELASFVEVLDLNIIKDGTDGEITATDSIGLARDYLLASGVRNPGKTMKYGVEKGAGSYGTGGTGELGYRPMPGIESVTIESQPPLGALFSATVKIKAWNMNQLSVLDMLYFRLGYTCLLQWGHTSYVKYVGPGKQPTFVKNREVPIDPFKVGITTEDIAKQITKKRIDSGYNYDAMLCLVTNYDWTQNADGSYDCNVKLTGLASVIESLKINSQANMPTVSVPLTPVLPFQPAAPVPPDPFSTGLAPTAAVGANQSTTIVPDSALKAFLLEIKNQAAKQISGEEFRIALLGLFSSGLDLPGRSVKANDAVGLGYKYGFNADYMAGRSATKEVFMSDYANYITLNATNNDTAAAGTGDQVSNNTYIPLSLLLAYLTNSCFVYEGKDPKVPSVYLDFNPHTNYCLRLPQQISVDPGVCLVECTFNGGEIEKLFTKKGVSDISKITGPASFSTATGATVNDKITATGISYLDGSAYRGKMMNIYVNVDYIISTYDSHIAQDKETKSVLLSAFLSDLMKGISGAMGGVNDFRLVPDEGGKVIRIRDVQMIDLPDGKPKAIPVVPVFGLDSFVREFSMKTEVSTNLGSMLAITARSSEGDLNSAGLNRDGSGFVAINNKLRDRLRPNIDTDANDAAKADARNKTNVDVNIKALQDKTKATGAVLPFAAPAGTSPTVNPFGGVVGTPSAAPSPAVLTTPPTPEQTAENQLITLANLFNKHVTNFYGFDTFDKTAGSGLNYSPKDVPGVGNYYTDALISIKNQNGTANYVTANGILPLALNITVSGISGIPLFQAFTLPSNRLPAQYKKGEKQLVGFTIAGLNHTIQNNQWTTQIRGCMINIPSNAPISNFIAGQKRLNSQELTEVVVAGGNAGAMKLAGNAVFKNGGMRSRCAQYTYNIARNYVAAVAGKPVDSTFQQANDANTEAYRNRLIKLGYTMTSLGTLTKAQLKSQISQLTTIGDIVNYRSVISVSKVRLENYANIYGHTQIYTGAVLDIGGRYGGGSNGIKWASSWADNYKSGMVYDGKPSDQWEVFVFRLAQKSSTTGPSAASTTGGCLGFNENSTNQVGKAILPASLGFAGKCQRKVKTAIPEGDRRALAQKLTGLVGINAAKAAMASIQNEQGFRGTNWNLGGVDITDGRWSFNPAYMDGYWLAGEGGTGTSKAFVSFTSLDTFLTFQKDKYVKKGFGTVTNANEFAEVYYQKWLGGDGAVKSLWSQQIARYGSIDNAPYLQGNAASGRRVTSWEDLRARYKEAFAKVYGTILKYF